MNKRTTIRLMIVGFILTGSIILCTLRWNAWFVMPDEPEWTGDTLPVHFTTFNDDTLFECQTTDTLAMVILGDVHNTLEQTDYRHIAQQCPNLQCFAQLGDFVEREQFYYKQQLRHQLVGTPFDSIPVMTCPGNHEYIKGVHRRLPESWHQSFRLPDNGPAFGNGTTYYVDFRNLRFIVIDTEDPQLLSDFTRLNTWVKSTISSALQPWVVVMMHRPVYASRKGRVNPLIWLSMAHALHKADIIFSGHDHTYARRGETLQQDDIPHSPVWIGVSSTTRARDPKNHSRMDTIVYGGPFYEYMHVTEHELTIQSRQADGICIDSVKLFKR